MSVILVDTTWAVDAPYTYSEAGMRVGGKLIIDGNPAKDIYATYALADVDEPRSGSARGMAIAFHLTDFSMINDTSGGIAPVVELVGLSGSSTLGAKTGQKLTWHGLDTSALSLSTDYQIDGLYTEEGSAGGCASLWIDGALVIDKRRGTGIMELEAIRHGLIGGLGKIAYDFRFGFTKFWAQSDPI